MSVSYLEQSDLNPLFSIMDYKGLIYRRLNQIHIQITWRCVEYNFEISLSGADFNLDSKISDNTLTHSHPCTLAPTYTYFFSKELTN